MSLEEAILDKVRSLPAVKQQEVLRFADGLQRQSAAKAVPSRDRSREMRWIRENRAAYADRWVVVEGDRLIAADEDGHKVLPPPRQPGSRSRFWYTFSLKIRSHSCRAGRMPVTLDFAASHRYASSDGIEIPIEIRVGDRSYSAYAGCRILVIRILRSGPGIHQKLSGPLRLAHPRAHRNRPL